MAKTPEGRVKDDIKATLVSKSLFTWHFMPVQYGFGVMGIPDFIGVSRGRFFAIEAKATKGKLSPLQTVCLDNIRQAGGKVWVVYGQAGATEFAQEFSDWYDSIEDKESK